MRRRGGLPRRPLRYRNKLAGCEMDYRYCWLRDATFTLYALMIESSTEEAEAWRDWLLRAVAGSPSQIDTATDWPASVG